MTLEEKQRALQAELAALKSWQDRLARVVERGRALPPFPEEQRTGAHRVEGCLSKLWIAASFWEGRCHFQCDSDSAIVKGIAGLLCEFYSGHTPVEILAVEPEFLAAAGITQHLSSNRVNGLARVRERIRDFAVKMSDP